MTRFARLLDALALGLGGVIAGILLTGGWTVAGVALTRPEDLLVALAATVGLRALVAPVALAAFHPGRVVAAGVAAYAVSMTVIALTRHRALRTHALDLGYYVQVVWNVAAGNGPRVTLPPMHSWGDHLSPILLVFTPAALVWPDAMPLLVGQTLILAAGGFAVFEFASRRLDDRRAGAAMALLYLVNPSLHGINIRDVHPQAFAIPLVIAAALAFDLGRHGWCAAALVLVLACREDAAVAVVGFGVWLALARGRWLAGAVVMAASVAVLALDLRVVMPYFRGEPYPHLFRWSHLGESLGEILVSLVIRPWRWIGVVATGPKLLYLLAMLAPLGFLPLAAPRALAAALPGLAMNLLALDRVLFHHRSQYQSFVLPFLVLAAVEGLAWLRTRRPEHAPNRWPSPRAALAFAVLASVVLTARTVNDLVVTRWILGDDARAAHRLIARVPPLAAVSSHERLVPHLATRPQIFVFPAGTPAVEYVVERETAVASVPSGYAVIARDGPWILWQRDAARSVR